MKTVLVANEKGGVGKTTISTLIENRKSLIINLDKERAISDIFPYKDILDYEVAKLTEEISSLPELMELLEESDYELVILDTKGSLSGEWTQIIDKIDTVIIPTEIGGLSEIPTLNFVEIIKDGFEAEGLAPKFGVIINKINTTFLDKTENGYVLGEKTKEFVEKIKEILKDELKVVTFLKYSMALKTRETKKLSLSDMMKQNQIAYLSLKREIERLNKELAPLL